MSQETRGSGVLVCLLAALCKGSPLSAVLLTAHLPHRQLPPGGFSESKWPPVSAEGEDVCVGGLPSNTFPTELFKKRESWF